MIYLISPLTVLCFVSKNFLSCSEVCRWISSSSCLSAPASNSCWLYTLTPNPFSSSWITLELRAAWLTNKLLQHCTLSECNLLRNTFTSLMLPVAWINVESIFRPSTLSFWAEDPSLRELLVIVIKSKENESHSTRLS